MIDSLEYRKTIGLFATGVTLIASGDGEGMRVMTANAVTSLSLEPLLILFCVHKQANLLQAVRATQGFSINMLRQDQAPLSNYFAGAWQEDEPPPFQFTPWQGGPFLEGCLAALGCELHEMIPGGDHLIVVGRAVAAYQEQTMDDPLLFYNGRYRRLGSEQ